MVVARELIKTSGKAICEAVVKGNAGYIQQVAKVQGKSAAITRT